MPAKTPETNRPAHSRTADSEAAGVLERPSLRRLAASNGLALTFGSNVLLAGFGVVTGSLTARMLGPQGRGELAAIQNLFWFVSILAMLGLPEATLYFTARHPSDSGRIASTGTAYACIATPLFFLLLYPLVPIALSAQSPQTVLVARWFILAIPLYALITVPTFAARGSGDLLLWNVLRILPGLGWLLLLIGFWMEGVRNPLWYAFGYLAVLAALVLPMQLLTRKRLRGSLQLSSGYLRKMLRYGLPQASAAIPQTLNLRMDQLVIGAMLPPQMLGLYVAAAAWSGAASLVLNAIGNVLFPRIAAAGDSPHERAQMLFKSIRFGVLAAVVLLVVLTALTPVAIPLLFGPQFAAAVRVGYFLVVAAVVCGMNVILEEVLRGLGDTTGVLWAEIAGLGCTFTMIVLLVRPFGLIGAAIASILGNGVTCGFLAPRICRHQNLELSEVLNPGSADLHSSTPYA